MSKKSFMGATIANLLKDLTPEIPPDKQHEVENDVVNKMKDILGDNWFTLPVTGPYMMVAVLVMNFVLLPQGITPITVADLVMTKSKEYGIDQKFNDLLNSAKITASSTGEFTSDKLKELSDYSEHKGKEVSQHLKDFLGESQRVGKTLLESSSSLGKNLFGGIKHKLNGNHENHQETESQDDEEDS